MAPYFGLICIRADLGVDFRLVTEVIRQSRMDLGEIEIELGGELVGRQSRDGVVGGEVGDAERRSSDHRAAAADRRIARYEVYRQNLRRHIVFREARICGHKPTMRVQREACLHQLPRLVWKAEIMPSRRPWWPTSRDSRL